MNESAWGINVKEEWADLTESDSAEDKIDCMESWELGFEAGVTQAEEEAFENWEED